MNATIAMLLVSTVPAAYVPQSAAQRGDPPRVGARRHVDVSFEGLATPPPASATLPFDCLESLSDQATGGCLRASSSPTLGLLHPYPGLNNAFVPRAFVGGGEDNRAPGSWSTVGGGYCNTASGTWGTVAGGAGNTASGSGATVGGGGGKPSLIGNVGNTAAGDGSTVGGGFLNQATGRGTTVGGGFQNSAAGVGDTIGGGALNVASGGDATVAGGLYNTASGFGSAVGGGGGLPYFYGYDGNVASGYFATIPGGRENTASGHYTFAAGRRARASHDGAFVWADSRTGLAKTSSTADEFNVYASGGVRLFTNSAATTGVLLAPGGSTWTMVSDRDAKENVEPVDARAVLEKVAELPVATWNYETQDDSVRHMGPMAQDFYAAFGLGLGEKTIDTIDPNGVALAAIQGLNELVVDATADMKARLAEKEAELEELRSANEALAARLLRLEALLDVAIESPSRIGSVEDRAPSRTVRRP